MRKKTLSRLSYSNVMATVAVFMAMGGGAYALSIPKNSVGAKQIKRNGVRASEIKKGAVRSSEVKTSSLLAKHFKAGQLPAGPPGARGATGPAGPTGAPAASEPEFRSQFVDSSSTSPKEVQMECPAGKTAIAGGYSLGGELPNLVVRQNGHPGAGFTDRWFIQVWEVPDVANTWSLLGRALCVKLQ